MGIGVRVRYVPYVGKGYKRDTDFFTHGTGLPKSISESLMSLNFRTSQVKLVKKSTSKSGKTCVVTQLHGTCCSKAGVECWRGKKSKKIMVVPGSQVKRAIVHFVFRFQTPQSLIF